MPFKSQAQMGAAFGGHLGSEMQKKASKWAHETPNINKLPKHADENIISMEPYMDDYQHPGCDDKVGNIFVVLKATPEMTPDNMVHKTHAFGVSQFEPSTVHGVYNDEDEANLVAESAVSRLHKSLKELETKKDYVMEKLNNRIMQLQKEVNHHMKTAGQNPEESDHHHLMAEKKMAIMKSLRSKHKMVREAKKELPQKNKK